MSLFHDIAENFKDAAAFGFAFPLRHASALAGAKLFHATLRGAGRLVIRNGSSDVAVLRQVFREREYDLARYPKVKAIVEEKYRRILSAGRIPLIIDGGANIGATPIWFATQFPQARILAVEPDPKNAQLCRANTRRHNNVQVIEAALGSTPGVVTLSNPTNLGWAVQTIRGGSSANVRVCTIPEITAVERGNAELFIVKIDIEGFEEDLFKTNIEWIGEAKVIFVEVHDWMLPRRRTSRPLQRAMAEHDFEMLLLGENLVYIR